MRRRARSPLSPRARRLRRTLIVLAAVVAAAVAFALPSATSSGHDRKGSAPSRAVARDGTAEHAKRSSATSNPTAGTACPCPNLAPGSDPAALPGPVLIADHLNNRLLVVDPNGTIAWEFPRPGDLAPGQSFKVPDDAFFTPDGRDIIATQEDDFVISEISVAQHRIVWRYGTP
ncbi:MAG: hypothetical protein ACRDYY_05430, partial [Acidimicrobiales bacterium]